MKLVKNKSYYDIISGLAAFECSHKVTLSAEELKDLTSKSKEKNQSSKDDSSKQKHQSKHHHKKNYSQPILHGYLGGKVNLKDAQYDLSHSLLGGYVPKHQLESLSSTDFSYYFHKSLYCEDALDVYDLLVGNEYRQLRKNISTETNPNNSMDDDADGAKNTNNNVRKAVICKKCTSKFVGNSRMRELENHSCTTI
ncbi:hypothetical protein TBLA_0C04070 [Henningerozyma blattae CBS 6284]|uniref:Uncharacterized protein n=1 Tax=Henningerozyma blattae (strain ATCC 34711 / CBS 6284 / DSM 70876 / NBRC 10599 / NRRL Y-10934 / UCD 77-7) TaxID=1071380 RepID=I2H1F5_HENB6|nr:hypothetical protein TBLA_0C04070 [Tetrapisispora blattae CBS 6284]CCH60207.1 hypothetical protein TBLA_0C04070 [Tetrapisispora blattae CBS 6284]